MNKTLISIILISMSSCASNPDSIDAAYVSPLKYAVYDCEQIGLELGYVGQRTNTLYRSLRQKRKADNWQMGVGLLLFWPTLFALEGGDSSDATEYAQLKGEFQALRQNSVEKRCGLSLQSPDEILNAARDAEDGAEETQVSDVQNSTGLAERLRELDDLQEQGLITEDEFQQLRQRALGIQ